MRFFDKRIVLISTISSVVLSGTLLLINPVLFTKADTTICYNQGGCITPLPTQPSSNTVIAQPNNNITKIPDSNTSGPNNPNCSCSPGGGNCACVSSNVQTSTPTNTPVPQQNNLQITSTPSPSNCHQVCQNVCN